MKEFIMNNYGNIIVIIILTVLFILAIKEYRRSRNGCNGCAYSKNCAIKKLRKKE